MTRILIIEDNPDLAFGLRRTLEFEGFDVTVAEDGVSGLREAKATDVELVVLESSENQRATPVRSAPVRKT